MWPEIGTRVSLIVRPIASHNEIDHIDHTIAIGIVLAEVDLTLDLLEDREEDGSSIGRL